MTTLVTSTEHSTGNPRQNHYARKMKKGIQNVKKEVKFSLFTDDVILYI